jgi:Flp pilus assembly protein CpaB
VQRKRLGYILIGGGLILALFVGVMVYSQVSEAERVKASLPTARVVIATSDIPARSEIAASMVNVRTVPDELVQAGAATKVEDVVGKFSPDAIAKGSVINTQKIGPVAVKTRLRSELKRARSCTSCRCPSLAASSRSRR